MNFYLVTSNKEKVKEFEEILGVNIFQISLDLEEIQVVEVDKVVENKAKTAFNKIEEPVLVEDSGLYLEDLEGLPGALAKLFEETVGYSRLCTIVGENRNARAETVIGYFDGREFCSFSGAIKGTIPEKPRGEGGFGWDSIFIPEGKEKTFAQMGLEQKNRISMRRKALDKLRRFLESNE